MRRMVGWGVGAALVLALVGCARAPKAQTLSGDFHALQVLGSGTVLYGEHAGVRRSVDGGRTWAAPDGAGDAMALTRTRDGTVLAGHEVLKVSRDDGRTWTDLGFGNLPGRDLHGFAVDPGRPEVWYANVMGRGVFRTADGQDWTHLSDATAGASVLAAGPQPALYALDAQGLLVSPDGVTWTRRPDAPRGVHLDVHPDSGVLFLAGPDGAFRSTNQGRTWTSLALPEGARLIAVSPQNGDQLIAVGLSGAVYRSANGGGRWQ
ncbi:hypothetical protein [Deinococcus sp. 12RED42]|uniref:WD40/YVTN/BNR-like repeat-containing protein n=1 Tax=Deinococcus sp. 12RED42 TaxID=2745872 RepID=UPI001E59DE68|nr:hypothetical protein [Deinococcus sp. 12RED42]MCD0164399.1 hypothetical protein [Deinococcus sp. 12RED42]